MVIQLSKAANQAKTKWNYANYAQIKVYVTPEVASAFKAVCAAAGVSMNSRLSQFIADYSNAQTKKKPEKATDYISNNRKRRKRHEELVGELMWLRDAQECANDNVHENFRNTENYEAAVERVAKMDEAIEILGDIY